MAQGSRFSAPKFNGGGLWDPRQSGVAWPEPIEGKPYVQGTNGMSGCGCGGAPVAGMGQSNFRDRFKSLTPAIRDFKRDNLINTIRGSNLTPVQSVADLLTPNVMFSAQQAQADTQEADKKKKKMLIIGGAVVLGVGLIFMANR